MRRSAKYLILLSIVVVLFVALKVIITYTRDRAARRLVAELVERNGKLYADADVLVRIVKQLTALGRPTVPHLLAAFSPDKRDTSLWIAEALGNIGDRRAVPALIRALDWDMESERGGLIGWSKPDPEVVAALGKLGDARAVPPLLKLLKDAKLPEEAKKEVRVALANIDPTVLPKPLWSRRLERRVMDMPPSGVFILHECINEHGQKWALFHSDHCGNDGDIWLARSTGRDEWGGCLLTGCVVRKWSDVTDFEMKDGYVTFKAEFQERNSAKPVQRKCRLALAELAQDLDHDGLTDIVEKRLNTNPQKTDTDGDGLIDSEDANPLVAPSKSPSDIEKVRQAVFAHALAGYKTDCPLLAIVDAPPLQEFYGYEGVVLCVTSKQSSTLSKTTAPVFTIGFKPVHIGFGGNTATVELYTSQGPRAGEGYRAILTKHKGRWFITSWQMIWIS